MRTPKRPLATLALLALVATPLTGCTDSTKTPAPNEKSSQSTTTDQPASDLGPDGRPIRAGEELKDHEATVAYVIDGDTVVVKTADGAEETVRLLGIDAPEIKHKDDPESKDECGGQEAKAALEEFLPQGTPVRVQVENDLSDKEMAKWDSRYIQPVAYPDRIDKYGRTLAYLVKTEPESKYNDSEKKSTPVLIETNASVHMSANGFAVPLIVQDIGWSKERLIEELETGINQTSASPALQDNVVYEYQHAQQKNLGLHVTCPNFRDRYEQIGAERTEILKKAQSGEIKEAVPHYSKNN